MTVARIILDQLGGGMFLAMTGAHTLISREDGLSFKLPSNFATDGINYIRITLNVMDTYDIEFGKTRRLKYTQHSLHKGIYFDGLQDLISRTTGLALSLGRLRSRKPTQA